MKKCMFPILDPLYPLDNVANVHSSVNVGYILGQFLCKIYLIDYDFCKDFLEGSRTEGGVM